MNRKTLQKVIDELAKAEPRLDYISGMLETLIETLPEEDKLAIAVNKALSVSVGTVNQSDVSDEAKALDYMAKAKLEGIKLLSDESNH